MLCLHVSYVYIFFVFDNLYDDVDIRKDLSQIKFIIIITIKTGMYFNKHTNIYTLHT